MFHVLNRAAAEVIHGDEYVPCRGTNVNYGWHRLWFYPALVLYIEYHITLAAVFLGPWMLLAASITLAREAWTWKPDGSDPASSTCAQTDEERHALFSKVLTVVEGVLESSPQFALQLITYV